MKVLKRLKGRMEMNKRLGGFGYEGERRIRKRLMKRGEKNEEGNGQQTAQLPLNAEFILTLTLAEFCLPKAPLGRVTLAPQESIIRPTQLSLISS